MSLHLMRGLPAHDVLLIVLGAGITVFGLVPGLEFYFRPAGIRYPGQKPLPQRIGRLLFVLGGVSLIYLAIKH
jgi:hypothetical protein